MKDTCKGLDIAHALMLAFLPIVLLVPVTGAEMHGVRQIRRSIAKYTSLAVIASTATIGLTAGPAAAYDGTNAAKYADQWATSTNFNYPYFNNDCTGFVSQSVENGGYSLVGGTSTTSDYQWWWRWVSGYGWENTHSWSVAHDYYNFLWNDSPGGVGEGTASGMSTNYYTPNSMVTGDVLFYDWGQGEGISHATIQVGIGYDPNYPNGEVWYGNYIDEHTTDRYHAFWSLYAYNAYRATTTIYFMHIFSNNY